MALHDGIKPSTKKAVGIRCFQRYPGLMWWFPYREIRRRNREWRSLYGKSCLCGGMYPDYAQSVKRLILFSFILRLSVVCAGLLLPLLRAKSENQSCKTAYRHCIGRKHEYQRICPQGFPPARTTGMARKAPTVYRACDPSFLKYLSNYATLRNQKVKKCLQR